MTILRSIGVGAMLAVLAGAGSVHAEVSYIDYVPLVVEAMTSPARVERVDTLDWSPSVETGAAPERGETFRPSFGDFAQPMTWLMMILGAGMIGASLRRRGETVAA
jgi:hypothetical protein